MPQCRHTGQACQDALKERSITEPNSSFGSVTADPSMSKIADICLTREMLEEADPQLL
jgi:hypothetical protein